MRILAVSHPCVTDVNQQFYAELERLGHEVELVVPANFRHEYAEEPVTPARWPTFSGALEQRPIGLSRSIPLHFYRAPLRPLIKRYAPDVLYVEEEPYAVSAWQTFYASRGLPMKRMIYSAQNIAKQYPPPFRWMERYVLSHADAAVVISTEVATTLVSKGYRGRIVQMPLGVDTTQFQPSIHLRANTRAQLGFEDDQFVVGYVGRFVEEKGIRLLLQAAQEFRDHHVALLMVGNGPLMSEIMEARSTHPDVITVADSVQHREIHQYINAMDLLVLPSITMPNWKEQFGRVIIESLACGVPVVGSDSGEIPKLLDTIGGGWTFPEGNVAKMIDVIYNVRNKEHHRSLVADAGRRHVELYYSKRALAKAFETSIQAVH